MRLKSTLYGLVAALAGLAAAHGHGIDTEQLKREVPETIALFKSRDSTLDGLFKKSHGYAVLPRVAKGGLVFGGAAGVGEVYEQGKLIGHVKLAQGTFGAQIGGQVYAQVIFFEDKPAMDRFKESRLVLSAQATAVAAAEGAAASAKYDHGVAVFVIPRTGLMAEASVGGQRLTFVPLK